MSGGHAAWLPGPRGTLCPAFSVVPVFDELLPLATNSGRRGRALWHEGPTSANAASDYSGGASWRMSGQKLGNPENVGLECSSFSKAETRQIRLRKGESPCSLRFATAQSKTANLPQKATHANVRSQSGETLASTRRNGCRCCSGRLAIRLCCGFSRKRRQTGQQIGLLTRVQDQALRGVLPG